MNNVCHLKRKLLWFKTQFASHRFRYVENSTFIFHSVSFATFQSDSKTNQKENFTNFKTLVIVLFFISVFSNEDYSLGSKYLCKFPPLN